MDSREQVDKIVEISVMIDYANAVLEETVGNYFERKDPEPWQLAYYYSRVNLLLGVASRYLFDAKKQVDELLAET